MQTSDTASHLSQQGLVFMPNPAPSAYLARSGAMETSEKGLRDAQARHGLLKSMVFPMCRPTFPAPPRRVMALFE